MKNLLTLLLVCSGLFYPTTLSAQTADEVIDRYYKAIGGKENWRSVKNSLASMTIKQMGRELEAEIFIQHPNINYSLIKFSGVEIIQAYDGENAWTLNPGSTKPELLDAAMAEEVKKIELQEPILDYRSKGYSAAYLGTETFNGATCQKVVLTRKDGEKIIYYFNLNSGLKVMELYKVTEGQQTTAESQTLFEDYQPIEGGFMMPYRIQEKSEGQVIVELIIHSYKLNVEMDKAKYTYPGN